VKKILLFLSLLFSQLIGAQTAVFDTGFNAGGNGLSGQALAIVKGQNRKTYVGGVFTTYNSISRGRIMRINFDGSIDNTFVTGTGFNNDVTTILEQPDGKIIVGGDFTSYNGYAANRIIRLHQDGSVDSTFNVGTGSSSGFNNKVTKIKFDSSGNILVSGRFTSVNGLNYSGFVRLLPSGEVDTTFVTYYGFNNTVNDVVELPNGKLVMVGEFTNFEGEIANRIVKLNSDGSRDNSQQFSNSYDGFDSYTKSILQLSNGDLIISGEFTSYNGVSCGRIVRINPETGKMNNNFNTNIGTGFSSIVQSIIADADDKLYAVGNFNKFNNVSTPFIYWLNADGSRNSDWNPNIRSASTAVTAIGFTDDGGVLFSGIFTFDSNGMLLGRIGKYKYCYSLIPSTASVDLITTTTVPNQLISTFDSPNYDYLWTKCLSTDALQLSSDITYTVTEAGNYGLQVKYGSCSIVSNCFEFTNFQEEPSAGVDSELQTAFTVFPNPTAGDLTIQFANTESDAKVEIIDITSRVIAVKQASNVDSISLSFKGDAGMYIVRVTTANGEMIKTIVRK
jgi:uncharacterized delta-60 repeat protein